MKIESEKIILLHPGKTGGTSVEHALKEKYLATKKLNVKQADFDLMFGYSKKDNLYLQHADLRFYKKKDIDFKEYTTITTARNPYDRLVSCYYYNGKDKKFSFEDFIVNQLPNHIENNKYYAINHFCPQIYFCKLGDYEVNNIIRLESFQEDLKKINLTSKFHYSKTVSRSKNYQEYYNQKTKDLVYELYKEDFEYLNYEK
jgi:hypothetical protein